jgi:hypothetical protein
MRFPVPCSRVLIPALVLLALGAAGCSRTDDKTASPSGSGAVSDRHEAAPAAGGPTTLKPGQWKTVTQTPMGPEESIQCVAEGYDPGAEAAQKASPCGKPAMTRTADGFQIEQACEKDHIKYALTGTVRGDFSTTATTDLDLTLSAFGRQQAMHLRAVSTYQGDCQPTTAKPDAEKPTP